MRVTFFSAFAGDTFAVVAPCLFALSRVGLLRRQRQQHEACRGLWPGAHARPLHQLQDLRLIRLALARTERLLLGNRRKVRADRLEDAGLIRLACVEPVLAGVVAFGALGAARRLSLGLLGLGLPLDALDRLAVGGLDGGGGGGGVERAEELVFGVWPRLEHRAHLLHTTLVLGLERLALRLPRRHVALVLPPGRLEGLNLLGRQRLVLGLGYVGRCRGHRVIAQAEIVLRCRATIKLLRSTRESCKGARHHNDYDSGGVIKTEVQILRRHISTREAN
eukprot:1856961-Pleurochrysis_carterae.AAC.3